MCAGGSHFVSSACDSTMRVWSLQGGGSAGAGGGCARTFSLGGAGGERAQCLALSSDDRWLFAGLAHDCSVRMLAFDSGQQERMFAAHTGAVSALALTSRNDYLVSGGCHLSDPCPSKSGFGGPGASDFVVIVWHVASGDVVFKLCGMMAPVTCLALTSSDTFLLTSCADETLRVFSLCLARELHELRGHQTNVCEYVDEQP